MSTTEQVALTDAQRAAILNQKIANYTRRGWTVQNVTGSQAVLTKQKKIGLWWNVLFTLITGGLWLFYVGYRVVNRKRDTLLVTVDAFGKVREK